MMSRKFNIAKLVLPPVITFFLILLIWEIIAHVFYSNETYMLPGPVAVNRAAAQNIGTLARATLTTALAAGLGFLASTIIGITIGVVLSSTRLIERSFYPFTVFLQTVPLVAIAPLLVLWFGVGLKAVAVSAFIVSVFPVIANTLAGIRSIDPALRDLFRLYEARPIATLFKLKLPGAMPSIFTGLRIASGLAVIGAIVGEFVAGTIDANAGLGILVMSSYRLLETEMVFAAVGMASFLGLLLFGIVNLAAWFTLRHWHTSAGE